MIARKTAKEISDLIIAQMESQLSIVVALLPKSFIRVLAKVLGGVFVLLYDYAGFNTLQMFIKTAVDKDIKIGSTVINPLQEWGKLVGIKKLLGQRTKLTIDVPVLTTGGTLYSGTKFTNTSTGVAYTLIGNTVLSSSSVECEIRATVVGAIGNVDAGGIISFQNAPPTCEKDCTVVSIDTDGSDEEDTEHLRKRIQIRWASRPQGGAYADYWDWASSVDGVLNVYPYSGWDIAGLPNSGAGTVVLFIESASGTDGIPTSALLEDVYDLINENESGLADRRPINAYTDQSLVRPITRTQFDLIISGLTVDDSVAAKAAVGAGMLDYFLSREPYINGLSIPPRKDIVSAGDVGGTVATIILAMGGIVLNVQVIESGVGVVTSYRQLQEGEKAKLGTVTWN